jgi:hypothetical protein
VSVKHRFGLVALFVVAGLLSGAQAPVSTLAGSAVVSGRLGWQPPTIVFAADLADEPLAVGGPNVALDGGRATAVWSFASAPLRQQVVMEADWSATAGWTNPRTLSRSGIFAVSTPQVAVNARGDAVVSWTDQIGALTQVVARFRPAGGDWQPVQLLSFPSEAASAPRVALDGRGRALVAWASSSGIDAAVHPFGGVWSRPFVLCVCGAHGFDLAMNPRGETLAVWEGHRGLWERTARSPTGGWSKPIRIYSFDNPVGDLQLALNARGAAVVAWVEVSAKGPPTDTLIIDIRPANGRFGRAQPIGVDTDGAITYWGLALTLAPTGEAVVMWAPYDCCLYSMSRRPGARSFTSKQVVATGAWLTASPVLRSDPRGNTLALWMRSDEQDLYVHAAERPPGGGFDTGIDIADTGKDSYKHAACSGKPSLATTPNGRLAVAVFLARPNTPMSTCTTVEAATFER